MITKINFDEKSIKSYAIRKLTPFECFRLMGVDEDTIRNKMQKTTIATKKVLNPETGKKEDVEYEKMEISASQQYKMAGNSIVVNVLTEIMENIFYPKESKIEKLF